MQKLETKNTNLLDSVLAILFLGLLFVDTLNGFLLHNDVILPLSIGQAYKLVLLSFLGLRLIFTPKYFLILCFVFLILLSPSILQFFTHQTAEHILPDIIKSSRYLVTISSYFFFVNLFKNNYKSNLIFVGIFISYIVMVINILLKYVGLGYPMYEFGEIGSIGFFYAGNEASILLVILTALISKILWHKKLRILYFLLGALSLFTALTITSKTSILGVLLVLILIPIKRPKADRINLKSFAKYSIAILALVPVLVWQIWKFIKTSEVYERFNHFWQELDLLTFIFSNRNTFLVHYWEIYTERYSFLDKVFGVGETQYNNYSPMGIIEIDIIDILFAQGVIGVLLFLFLLGFVYAQAKRFCMFPKYPYASFSLLMLILLFVVSCFTGHTFNSGMAGPFIGLSLALMYKQED